MTELDEPKSSGWMWLAIMGMTVMFVGAILVFTENGSLPTTNLQTAQTSRPPRLYRVYYTKGVFSPTNLRIQVKDSVAFRNNSQQVIALDGAFGASGDLAPAAVFTHVFTEAGTYDYYNTDDITQKGTIIVRP